MSAGKLPEGWVIAPVSTVTTLIRGVTYKKEQAINYLKDDYLPLIRANNIQNGKFDTTDLVFVPKNLVKESPSGIAAFADFREDRTVPQKEDTVCIACGKGIMRYHQNGCSQVFVDTLYRGQKHLRRMAVQCAGGFVRQN